MDEKRRTGRKDIRISTVAQILTAVMELPGSDSGTIAKALGAEKRYTNNKLETIATIGLLRKDGPDAPKFYINGEGAEILKTSRRLEEVMEGTGRTPIKLFKLCDILRTVAGNYGIFKSQLRKKVSGDKEIYFQIQALERIGLLEIKKTPDPKNAEATKGPGQSCYITEKGMELIGTYSRIGQGVA